MIKGKFTFVVVVSKSSREDWEGDRLSDLERVQMMLNPSLEKFLDKDSVEEVIYVCPYDEMEYIDVLNDIDFNSRIITDDILVDESVKFSSGWFKQQVLKLKIANHITTEHYILLDADMFATRHTKFSDLITNDKARIGVLSYHTHKDWWENTADLMGYDIDYGLKDKVPGCTPQILYTNLVKELMGHLSDKVFKGEDWVKKLSELCPSTYGDTTIRWTEYCLYWLYLIKEKGLYNYYNPGETILVGNSVWSEEVYDNLSEDHLHKVFYPLSEHHFSIIQSNIVNTDVQEICYRVRDYVVGSNKSIGS